MKTNHTKTTWIVLTVLGFVLGIGGGIIADAEKKEGYENGYSDGYELGYKSWSQMSDKF